MATGYGQRGRSPAPLGAGATIAAALNVYMNNAPQLWAAVAVVIVPLRIIELLLQLSAIPSGAFIENGTLYGPGLTSASLNLGLSFVVALIGGLAELLATGAVFRLVLDDYRGRPTSINASFDFAATKLISLIWMSILVAVFVAIGLLLFVLPGIYLAVAFCVAIPVLMTEGLRGFGALGRSRRLVSGRWWATFGRLILAAIIAAIVSAVLGVINLASILNISSVPLYLTANTIISTIGSILYVPFTAAVAIVIYIDLRVRKEGIDLDQLDGPPPDNGGWPAGYVHPPPPPPPPADEPSPPLWGAPRPSEPGAPPSSTAPSFDEPAAPPDPPQTIGGWPRNQPRGRFPTLPQPPAEPESAPPQDSPSPSSPEE